jgi:hypothetical protein
MLPNSFWKLLVQNAKELEVLLMCNNIYLFSPLRQRLKGWPRTLDLPASAIWALRLQVCATTLSSTPSLLLRSLTKLPPRSIVLLGKNNPADHRVHPSLPGCAEKKMHRWLMCVFYLRTPKAAKKRKRKEKRGNTSRSRHRQQFPEQDSKSSENECKN